MATNFERRTHEGIQTLIPYTPGKSKAQLQKESGIKDVIKLASNENPRGCSPKALSAIASITSECVAAYPSPLHHPLMEKLASKLRIKETQLFLSNGSDAIFGHLINCFALHQKKHILTHQYAFSTYAIQAKTLNVPVVTVDVDDWRVNIERLVKATTKETALIFLANPNNPTGLFIPLHNIKYLLEQVPEETIVVLDEAYFEYATQYFTQNTLEWILEHPNLVITRTFSKIYGLAGLRIGYAVAHQEIVDILKKVQLPFLVNQVALNAAYSALDDELFIEETLRLNVEGMQKLEEGFHTLGLSYFPSAGNFLTFDCRTESRPLNSFLESNGLIARPLHPYQMPNYLRVTVGTSAQNKRFLELLRQFYEK